MSPEPRPIGGLTPRVASRVASHNSPGIIFSVPPRRPPRVSPRYRHQTNSFSFDESERSSLAYEQQRTYSGSMDESTPRPEDSLSLHDELHGSSLGSLLTGTVREDVLTLPEEHEVTSAQHMIRSSMKAARILGTHEASPSITPSGSRRDRDFIFSSPRLEESEEQANDGNYLDAMSSPSLPLPPPFSAAGRSVSDSEALAGSRGRPNLGASPVAISSSSPGSHVELQSLSRGSNQPDRVVSTPALTRHQSSPVRKLQSLEQMSILTSCSLVL